MYYPRAMRQSVLDASAQFPVVLLTGPRQVGKTTLLQHLCEKGRKYATLDDPALRTLAREDPGLFLQRFEPPVLIDEIQYAPQLLPLIKMSVDTGRRTGLFWLTGSQQFQMMKGITETLAGRVAILNLLGFSNRERRQLPLDVSLFSQRVDDSKSARRLSPSPAWRRSTRTSGWAPFPLWWPGP
jgi:hypothetical protein